MAQATAKTTRKTLRRLRFARSVSDLSARWLAESIVRLEWKASDQRISR
jgi:hypothetical protein